MSKPIYTLAAQQDLEEILKYIARDKPNAAIAWVAKIESKCLLLAVASEIGEALPHLGPNVRGTTVGRYLIFYRKVGEQVEFCES